MTKKQKMKMFKKILFYFSRIVLNPALLVFVACGTIGYELFMDFNRDTLFITNSAFLAFVAVAGVCFSNARVLDDKKCGRALVVYSAEMFLVAALALLFISIFKLSFQGLVSGGLVTQGAIWYTVVKDAAMIFVFIFLLLAAVSLYIGLNCVSYYLLTKSFVVYSEEEQEVMYLKLLKKYKG